MTSLGSAAGRKARLHIPVRELDGQQGVYSESFSSAPQNSSVLNTVSFILSYCCFGLSCLLAGLVASTLSSSTDQSNSTSSAPGHSRLTLQSLSIDLELRSMNLSISNVNLLLAN